MELDTDCIKRPLDTVSSDYVKRLCQATLLREERLCQSWTQRPAASIRVWAAVAYTGEPRNDQLCGCMRRLWHTPANHGIRKAIEMPDNL